MTIQTTESRKATSLATLVKALRRRKLYVLAPMLVLTAGSIVFALRLPERYRSRALLAAESAAAQDYMKTKPTMINIQEQMRMIRETLFSRPVLESVIAEFKLQNGIDAKTADWTSGIESLIGGFKLYAQSKDSAVEKVVDDLRGRIGIEIEGTDAFYISFEGSDRRQVANIANRLAELFAQRASAIRDQRAEEAAGFISSEVERLRRKLAAQEDQLKRYRQQAVHEMPEQLAENMRMYEMLEDQLHAKQEKIASDQAQRAAITDQLKELEKQGIQQVPDSREKSPVEIRIEQLRLAQKELQAKYTPNHPELARLDKEIRDLERLAGRNTKGKGEPTAAYLHYVALKGELQAIEQRLKSYRQEAGELASRKEIYRRRVESVPQHERAVAQLMRDAEVTRSQYLALIDKQNEARLDARLDRTNRGLVFTIVEPARVPSEPYTPHRDRIVLAGFLTSLGLGALMAFLVEQMDTSFDTVDDFQAFTSLPVLTVIPAISRRPQRTDRPRPARSPASAENSNSGGMDAARTADLRAARVVALTDPASIAAEQYGVLAMKLRQRFEGESSKILILTSAAGGEGKTLTAINLALSLSSAVEGRVLLVDSDLRRPRIHEYLGIAQDRGLSDLLKKPGEDAVSYTSRVRDLYVLPGCSSLANPIGMLASRRTRDLLAGLRKLFRFIVMDSPPILPLADSHILAGLADGVVLVVRARQTRRELFQRALESFEASNVLGVVLNDMDYRHTHYTYAYEYYKKHYIPQQ
jgi:polysaccharide chain length determinant protein (PEP-CTERM system associated)